VSDRGNGDPPSGQEDKIPAFVKFSKYAAIGLEFPSTILGGLALGYLLDLYFDKSPWFIMTLTLLALVGAFVRLIVMLQRFSGDKR
jgi:F0F1-type ATP synthase assembly protein I